MASSEDLRKVNPVASYIADSDEDSNYIPKIVDAPKTKYKPWLEQGKTYSAAPADIGNVSDKIKFYIQSQSLHESQVQYKEAMGSGVGLSSCLIKLAILKK